MGAVRERRCNAAEPISASIAAVAPRAGWPPHAHLDHLEIANARWALGWKTQNWILAYSTLPGLPLRGYRPLWPRTAQVVLGAGVLLSALGVLAQPVRSGVHGQGAGADLAASMRGADGRQHCKAAVVLSRACPSRY